MWPAGKRQVLANCRSSQGMATAIVIADHNRFRRPKMGNQLTRRDMARRLSDAFGSDIPMFGELVNRWFDEPWYAWPRYGTEAVGATALPPVDIRESDDAFLLDMALPGWKPTEVHVSSTAGVLTISGEQTDEPAKKDGHKVHRQEIARRTFTRSFTMPDVVTESATAKFADGVLHLTLPKAQQVKPVTIKIGVN
jgi:HSP20 family protein